MARRLRRLTEAECYARCYGGHERTVRIVHVHPRVTTRAPRLSGEELRLLFEARLDAREPEAA